MHKTKNLDFEQRGFQVFAAIGKFSVRFRWLIVVIWVAGTFFAVNNLPSLSGVTQSSNSSFLPASAPSEKAIQLGASLGENGKSQPIPLVVATKDGQKLTPNDLGLISTLDKRLSKLPNVVSVRPAGESPDGQAFEAAIIAKAAGVDPAPLVDSLRTTISSVKLSGA